MTTATIVEAVAPRATVIPNTSSFRQAPAPSARAHGREGAPGRSAGTAARKRERKPGTARKPGGSHNPQPAAVCLWKRCLDLFIVLLSLPFVLPLMAAVALWIRLVSRGPAIFRQKRIGLNGQTFTLYKFRSMHVNADNSPHAKHFSQLVKSGSPMVKLDLLCDSRLIPLGCLLRAAGLDELPQLFNVLRGDMSLVGPRPCLPEEYRFFSHSQRVRFQALPGLTGLWQSVGKGVSTFDEMNEMDARYVRTASPLLDLSIICCTPLALLRQMRLAWQSRRSAAAKKATFECYGAKPLGGYSTQRLR